MANNTVFTKAPFRLTVAERIARDVRENYVESGLVGTGEALPSMRELQERYNTSTYGVQRAWRTGRRRPGGKAARQRVFREGRPPRDAAVAAPYGLGDGDRFVHGAAYTQPAAGLELWHPLPKVSPC